jgi:hypothetical protein
MHEIPYIGDDLDWQISTFSGTIDCIAVAHEPDGSIAVRSTTSEARISVTPQEMTAFVQGVKAGEFDRFA